MSLNLVPAANAGYNLASSTKGDDYPCVIEWTGDDDYHLFGGFRGDNDNDNELIAVAGVLESHLLHHTRHAWLYDLVVDESERGKGYGASMVEYVEEWAEERGCDYVALASPVEKDGAHQFY
ncbi:MAG: GNAT family N-acetyltransferase, partial [Halobacteria archaeon]|nr:GNAT family N-acetyltransferase [Halobacteria archaeon]